MLWITKVNVFDYNWEENKMQIFFYTIELLDYLLLKEIYEHYNKQCTQLQRLKDLQFINKIIVKNNNCADFIVFSFYI
jgi:hypothetical protein